MTFLVLYLVHAAVVVLGVWLIETARRRLGRRICAVCDYDLRGQRHGATRCPECGVLFHERPPREPEDATYLKWRVAAGIGLIVLSVGSCCSGLTISQVRGYEQALRRLG